MKRYVSHLTETPCNLVLVMASLSYKLNPKTIKVVLGAALTIFLTFNDASACLCSPAEFKYALESAEAVFSGEVIKIAEDTVVLKVREVWKGNIAETISMYRQPKSTCDFHFEAGETYLVFASLSGDGRSSERKLHTWACARTNKLRNAVDDLKKLGKGVLPEPGSRAPIKPRASGQRTYN